MLCLKIILLKKLFINLQVFILGRSLLVDVPGMTLIRKYIDQIVMGFGEEVLLCILTMRFMLNRVWTFQIRPLNVSGPLSDRNGYHERFQD